MSFLFVSYCRRDGLFVESLVSNIENRGIVCWRDVGRIVGGDNVSNEVLQAIKECAIVIVAVSANSNKSKWVKREIDIARLHQKKILPIVIDRATIPPAIASLHRLFVPSNGGLDEIADGIVASVNRRIRPGSIDSKQSGRKLEAPMSFSQEQALVNIETKIDNHPVCRHEFFSLQKSRPWPLSWVRVFSPDYYYVISSFPKCLGQLVSSLDSDDAAVVADILFQETGCGDPARSHSRLFAIILGKLGINNEELDASPHHKATNELTSGMRHLYSDPDKLFALGAQYALERQALSMIENLDNIFTNMRELINEPKSEYFLVHLKDEPGHMRLMRNIIKRYLVDEASCERIQHGGEELLSLLHNFWSEMYHHVSSLSERIDLPSIPDDQRTFEDESIRSKSVENDILRFLLNIASDARDLHIKNSILGSIDQHVSRISDVVGSMEGLVNIYVLKLLPSHLRVYVAYRLNKPSGDILYRFGISRCGYSDWRLNQAVLSNSNIDYVFRFGNPREHLDTTRASKCENQRIEDELSVYNAPVKIHHEPVCVLGLSSPNEQDVEPFTGRIQELAIYFEIVLSKFVRGMNSAEIDVVSFVRSELATFFESRQL